jgi:hypothetical protein
MKNVFTFCSLVVMLAGTRLHALPLGTAFTYQGRLTDGANPANGSIPMAFELWDADMGGMNVGIPSSISKNVPVANGLFSVDLDFGSAAFSGDARWLEIRVNGTLMTSRQRVAPTPNALYASTAGTVKTGNAPSTGQILSYDGSSLVWQTPGGPNLWSLSGASAYYNGGNVGIGTAGPSGKLTVATSDDTTPSFVTAFDGRHVVIGTDAEGVGLSYSANNGAGYISALAPGVAWKDLVLQARSLTFNLSGERSAFSVLDNGDLRTGPLISVASDFYLGHPDRHGIPGRALVDLGSTLHLNYNADWTDTVIGGRYVTAVASDFLLGHPTRRGAPGRALVDFGSALHLNFDADWTDTVIGGKFLTAVSTDFLLGHPTRRGAPGRALVDFTDTLHLNFAGDWANTVIGGNNVSVCTLTIRGGCDLAEPFPIKETEIEKGSVVVIDEEGSGRLKLSTRAYDTQVAGIVSGANGVNAGIALHQEGVIEGGKNVALTGRVYVQADASSSPIKPGDLLTTSDTPGHAMKVTDHAKAQGAILGKAMSVLKEGKGMVLVLVTLQ